MLETDCIIPKHVPIPHDPVTLYGNARAVRALQREGFGKWGIIKKLHISEEAYNDAIYEINKAKAVDEINGIAPKKRKRRKIMIENLKEKVREMKEQGMKNVDIAREMGISAGRVSQIVKELGIAPAQINEDFDNAVNQMIEESKPQEIVQTDKPVTMTEEHTVEAVPDTVIEAVREQIESDELYVESNLSSIRELQQENEKVRTKIAALKKWLAEVSA